MPKCPNCNENLPKKQRFCGYCGTDVTTGESPSDLFSNLNKKNEDMELSYWARQQQTPIKKSDPTPKVDPQFNDLPYVPDETEIEMRKSGIWDQFDDKDKKDKKDKNKQPTPVKPEQPEPYRIKSEDLLSNLTTPPPTPPPSSTTKRVSPTPPPTFKPTINIPAGAMPAPKTAPSVNIPKTPPVVPKTAAPTINPLFNTNEPTKTPVAPSPPVQPAAQQPDANKKLSKFDIFESLTVAPKKKNNDTPAPPTHVVASPTKIPPKSIPETPAAKPNKSEDKIIPKEPKTVIDNNESAVSTNHIKMPVLKGLSRESAKTTLTKLGLSIILKTVNSDTILKGEVVSQSIPAGNEVIPGEAITITISVGNWSKWTKDPYLADDKHEIESQTIFRSRSREKTIDHKESDKSTMEGYTLYDSKKEYSNWETDNYYSKDSRPPSDTCEILKIMTGFKYYGWTYRGIDSIPNVYASLEMAIYLNPQTTKDNWEYIETVDKTDATAESKTWSPDNSIDKTPAGDEVESNISFRSFYVGGIEYAAKLGTAESVWTKYRKCHLKSVIYMFKAEKFTPWSEWSDWALETDVEADILHEVESQTLYRRRRKADS